MIATKIGKRVQEIINLLQSGKDTKILSALEMVRKHGTPEVIPYMIKCLVSTDSKLVYREITTILNQLKDNQSGRYIIESLKLESTDNHKNILVAALWESGLDVTDHIDFLIDLALNDDYLTCLECLTTIENMELSNANDDEMMERVARINMNLGKDSDEHDALLLSLAEVLKSFVI